MSEKFYLLEDGDFAEITKNDIKIFNSNSEPIKREETKIDATPTSTSKGNYTHFMEKEIYEQPDALGNTINGRLGENDVLEDENNEINQHQSNTDEVKGANYDYEECEEEKNTESKNLRLEYYDGT